MPPKIQTHLFTGFLGTGKTSAIRSLIAQKPHSEQWLIIVNEFGEIGIDGAVLAENGIPVAEISGGCLCCSAGEQMDSTIRAMLQKSAKAANLFPPKSRVAEVRNAELDIAWLDTPTAEKSRYRIKALPENTLGYQSQGYTFPAGRNFDGEKLTQFFNDLPQFTQGLVRAKGVFQVLDTWVWLNWADGQWGANQIAWRRDSRFELIAQAFDADEIERRLNDALEDEAA